LRDWKEGKNEISPPAFEEFTQEQETNFPDNFKYRGVTFSGSDITDIAV
jgi:hypothetical protein